MNETSKKRKDPNYIPTSFNRKRNLTADDFRQKDHFEDRINTTQIAWGQIHMAVAGPSNVSSRPLSETIRDSSLFVNPTPHTDLPHTVNSHDYATMGQATKESEDMNAEVNPHGLELPSTPSGMQI